MRKHSNAGQDLPLARRLQTARVSSTAAIFDRAAELRARGVDVISFAVGEPDFSTPKHICEAAKRAVDAGVSRYTSVRGIAELRAAICDDSRRRRGGVAHSPNQVVVSTGGKQALFNLAHALYDPGDEVIIPTPSYVSYPEQARLAGATPVLVPCSEADGFLLSEDALRRALTPRTKALVLCTPSNPTGAVYSPAQLGSLADVARERNIWIIVDEVYGQLTYDGFAHQSILEVAPDLRERVAVVDAVSKTYAMTGWRIGWVLASERVASACEALQSQTTTNPTAVSQHAALAALTGSQQCVETMRASFQTRRDRMVQGLNAIAGLSCCTPRGAFYAFARVVELQRKRIAQRQLHDDVAVAEWLLEEAKVAVVPGTSFGAQGYVRLSYAVSLEQIEQGLQRIARAVALLAD